MNIKTSTLVILAAFIALLLSCSLLHAGSGSIRILHMNDFHGHALPEKTLGSDEIQGGISYCASLSEVKKKEMPTLLLAAGDMIQGDSWANLFQGKSVIEVMNIMDFDAMVVGNHEFDFGLKALRERIRDARFPILGANVQGIPELKPYIVKDVGGLKVAVIGVVTKDTMITTHRDNIVDITFLPVTETVNRYVKELRSQVDLIIVLTHIGLNADMMLADNVKGIDVIVGGHTHTKTSRHMIVGDTIIVQAWDNGRVLGLLDITVKDGKVVEAASRLEEIKPDPKKSNAAAASVVNRYATEMNALLDKVIGEASEDLDGAGPHVRTRETNLGNLVADMLKERSGAEAAIVNGGGIRSSIKKGAMTVNDLYNVLPFNNHVISIALTGEQIRKTLEHGVSAVESGEGCFPQVSGITFTYAPKNKIGSRVCAISVNGNAIDPQKLYTVATNDFLAAGGDGYQVFREAIKESPDFSSVGDVVKGSRIVYNDAGTLLRDVAVEYITARQKITSRVEGRIKEGVCDENPGKQQGD